MSHTTDIVIIGAGIVGLCTAMQLHRSGGVRVTVLEQSPAPGAGSSGASSAVCRHLYTYQEMINLARDGIDIYRHWQDFTGLEEPRARFNDVGVVWIGGNEPQRDAQRLQRHGIPANVLDAATFAERFPSLSTCKLAPDFETGKAHVCEPTDAFLCEESGGFMDPQNALDDLTAALTDAAGVELRFSATVERIEHDDAGVRGVRLASGESISCAIVLNASGPWCNRLLAPFEFAARWPLEPTRIQVLHLPVPTEMTARMPVCGDFTSGVYFRPQGVGQLIAGSTLEADEQETIANPDEYDRFADNDFKMIKMHALKHRVPSLSDHTRIGSYCGLYTVNRADMHPLVGATPVDGLFAANGFSGHGFKLGPAVGSLLARAIDGARSGFDTEVDLDFLSWDREPLHLDTMNVLA